MLAQLSRIYNLITELEAQTELPISEWNESEIYNKIYNLKKDVEKLNNIKSCCMSLAGLVKVSSNRNVVIIEEDEKISYYLADENANILLYSFGVCSEHPMSKSDLKQLYKNNYFELEEETLQLIELHENIVSNSCDRVLNTFIENHKELKL